MATHRMQVVNSATIKAVQAKTVSRHRSNRGSESPPALKLRGVQAVPAVNPGKVDTEVVVLVGRRRALRLHGSKAPAAAQVVRLRGKVSRWEVRAVTREATADTATGTVVVDTSKRPRHHLRVKRGISKHRLPHLRLLGTTAASLLLLRRLLPEWLATPSCGDTPYISRSIARSRV